MEQIYWPLKVLSRSIDYKNLTGASKHVGISQPQLSRLVSQLEESLKIKLLDRSSPRHASWTPEARELAEIYKKNERSLNHAIFNLKEGQLELELRIGCLEGLSYIAKGYAQHLLLLDYISSVTLDIYDLNQLEAKFMSLDLDLIFSSRNPKIQKFKYEKLLGYQKFTQVGKANNKFEILSSYEFQNKNRKERMKKIKRFISSSLHLRIEFQKSFGSSTIVPSQVFNKKESSSVPAIILGQNNLHPSLWSEINKLTLK